MQVNVSDKQPGIIIKAFHMQTKLHAIKATFHIILLQVDDDGDDGKRTERMLRKAMNKVSYFITATHTHTLDTYMEFDVASPLFSTFASVTCSVAADRQGRPFWVIRDATLTQPKALSTLLKSSFKDFSIIDQFAVRCKV